MSFWQGVQRTLVCSAIHINNWRIIPRLILLAYWHLTWRVCEWFMHLPEPTTQQVTFVSLLITNLPIVIGFYLKTGGIRNPNDETTQNNNQIDK